MVVGVGRVEGGRETEEAGSDGEAMTDSGRMAGSGRVILHAYHRFVNFVSVA